MKKYHFISRENVTAYLRQLRDGDIARAKSVSEAESILKAAGREDLLSYVKDAEELGEAYSPPTDSELAAIQVGDVVRVCTPARYPHDGFDWNPLLVLRTNGEEIHGILRGGFMEEDQDERVTLSIEYVCDIDDRSGIDTAADAATHTH